jgi:hypothetical protein
MPQCSRSSARASATLLSGLALGAVVAVSAERMDGDPARELLPRADRLHPSFAPLARRWVDARWAALGSGGPRLLSSEIEFVRGAPLLVVMRQGLALPGEGMLSADPGVLVRVGPGVAGRLSAGLPAVERLRLPAARVRSQAGVSKAARVPPRRCPAPARLAAYGRGSIPERRAVGARDQQLGRNAAARFSGSDLGGARL